MRPELFNPKEPSFIRNPYPTYDRLRSSAPIFYHADTELWFITSYEDVNALLRDRRLGRSIDDVLRREQRDMAPALPEYESFTRLSTYSMFDMEPPNHTRIRRLVQKAFTPRRVRRLRPRIEALATNLIEKALPSGQMDLIEQFAEPLPVVVIAELLGVPQADRHRLRPWSRDIVAMFELKHSEDEARRAVQAAQEFWEYLRYLTHLRRQEPQDDLITALVFAEDAGDQLREEELIATCVLLLNAGHEATVNVIGNGMLALLKHPMQLEMLKEQPSLMTPAIEEMMRYDTPLQLFRRWVLEDISYKGFSFCKGAKVALILGAANRDPAQFDAPHYFDIRRSENAHISFGAGVHYCLGAPLARLELEIAFSTLLQRLPDLRLAQPDPAFRHAYVIRGLEALPIAF